MGADRGVLGVKRRFSDNQLKEIGAILLEWNELEERSASLFSSCLDLETNIWVQVVKAIIGLDARFSIIGAAIKHVGMPADLAKKCNSTMSKISENPRLACTLQNVGFPNGYRLCARCKGKSLGGASHR